MLRRTALPGQHQRADGAADTQFVQLVRHIVPPRQIETEPVDGRLVELEGGGGLQADAQAPLDALGNRQLVQGQVRGKREVARRRDLDRPERDVPGAAELARREIVAAEQAAHRAASRNGPLAGGERGLLRIRLQLRNHHRWRRREIVRVDDLEQRLREPRKLCLELQLDARRHEAEAFEQPLDVGIGDLQAAHAKPGGNLRKLLGELGAHLAQVLQLEVVMLQEPRIHGSGRPRHEIGDLHLAGLEVDFGAHHQFERHRLRPELAANLDADHVVMIRRICLHERRHLERCRRGCAARSRRSPAGWPARDW